MNIVRKWERPSLRMIDWPTKPEATGFPGTLPRTLIGYIHNQSISILFTLNLVYS
jgi:hypothetical protein